MILGNLHLTLFLVLIRHFLQEPTKTSFNRPRAPSNPVTPARPVFTFPDSHSSDPSSPDVDESPLAHARPPSQSGFRSLRLGKSGSISNPSLPFDDGKGRSNSASPERVNSEGGLE